MKIERVQTLPYIDYKILGIDIESSGLDPFTDNIVAIQIAAGDTIYLLEIGSNFESVVPYLIDKSYLKIGHNLNFDGMFFKHKLGVDLVRCFDTYLAHRILTSGLLEGKSKGGLDDMLDRWLQIKIDKRLQTSFIGQSTKLSDAQVEYAANDVAHLESLQKKLALALRNEQLIDVAKLEFDLLPVIIDMQHSGMKLDINAWQALMKKERANYKQTKSKLFDVLGVNQVVTYDFFSGEELLDFNPASHPQMKKALSKVGIDLASTTEDAIKEYCKNELGMELDVKDETRLATNLQDPYFKVLRSLIDFREHEKVISMDMLKHVKADGRIHSRYKQIEADTGRMSSTDPNMQNIKRGSDFRSCFISEEGRCINAKDYSQIELRLLADQSGDETMMAAFRNGEDIHTATAVLLWGKERAKEMRPLAKSMNFLFGYGGTEKALALKAGVDIKIAKEVFALYGKKYPNLVRFKDEVAKEAWQRGYAITALGRKRYIDKTNVKFGAVRNMLCNSPIQGTAADIFKLAALSAWRKLKEIDSSAKLVNCVHDELVFEMEYGDDTANKIIYDCMIESAQKLMKKCPADASKGEDAKCWQK
jgi:DNA polymerase I-like protein with 3'-5' exonuclease and polymerase domains